MIDVNDWRKLFQKYYLQVDRYLDHEDVIASLVYTDMLGYGIGSIHTLQNIKSGLNVYQMKNSDIRNALDLLIKKKLIVKSRNKFFFQVLDPAEILTNTDV